MDTSDGRAGICPEHLDTSDAADRWDAEPRWAHRPKDKPLTAAEIAGKNAKRQSAKAGLVLPRAEYLALEWRAVVALRAELPPWPEVAAELGEVAWELGATERLVVRAVKLTAGLPVPASVLAVRLHREGGPKSARQYQRVLADLGDEGVLDATPVHEQGRAACSRRGNVYALGPPDRARPSTQNVVASRQGSPEEHECSRSRSDVAAPCSASDRRPHEISLPRHAVSPEPEVVGPTTPTAAVRPARPAETRSAAGGAPEGRVSDTRAELEALAAAGNECARDLLAHWFGAGT